MHPGCTYTSLVVNRDVLKFESYVIKLGYMIPTYRGQAIYLQLYLVGQMRESPQKQEMHKASFQLHPPSAICIF